MPHVNTETIHISNLAIGYPGKKNVKIVAEGIQAGINSGELTCLLGSNGVGKSTLLRTLSAFQPKLSGQIRILGKDIEEYTDKQMAKVISVVLTERCDVQNITVTELVGLGRSPYTGFWGNIVQRRQGHRRTGYRAGRHKTPGPPNGTYLKRRRTAESHDSQSTGAGNPHYLSG